MAREPADTPGRRSEQVRRAGLPLLARVLALAGTAPGLALQPLFHALPASAGSLLVVAGPLERPADP